MQIYVVVGVWSGCIEHVTAYRDRAVAEKELEMLKKDYGIREGLDEESEHAAGMFELMV